MTTHTTAVTDEQRKEIEQALSYLQRSGYFHESQFLRALLGALVATATAFDIEQMLRDCVPGGYSADPQKVADDIRAWFEERAAPAAPLAGL